MNRDGKSRRLLRLRGWGRDGGIYGREAEPGKKVSLPVKPNGDRVEGMRRAAALYLTSRECVARDVAFLLLPGEAATSAGAKTQSNRGGDLMVFTRKSVFMVGFAMTRNRPDPALTRLAHRIGDLGQTCRIIHAETPAHAVEQLARLIDGG